MFDRDAVEAVGEEWVRAEKINEALKTLRELCLPVVERVGDYARSKIAWKLANYRMAMIYRGVSLGASATQLWNTRHVLTSVLAARALVETAALLRDFTDTCERALEASDLEQLNRVADDATFATRLKHWNEDSRFPPSKNVLTVLDRLDKKFGGIRGHYDRLSEFCHPNYLGHFAAFGKLDHDTGRVAYSFDKIFNKGLLSHVFGGLLLTWLIEIDADRLANLIPKVAELQHQQNPVRRE